MKLNRRALLAIASFALCLYPIATRAADHPRDEIGNAVDAAVQPLMAKYHIPGMAVGVIVNGKPYVFNYGLAVTTPRQPVTGHTLFELGSISKTLTATLASYAQDAGDLSLSDPTGKYLPSLQGTKFGAVTLLNLGTHTPGGLPLQVPANVQNDDQLLQYFHVWHPTCKPGTCRTYTNIGIGTLGLITAKSMHGSFADLMEHRIFRPLGMTSTYIDVPPSRMSSYAQGYTSDDRPIRMVPGELSAEAYGVRSTARDMLRFLQANMNLIHIDPKLQRAIDDTHTGYFQAGGMTQDLIWEQYPYPAPLQTLLRGNSPAMAFNTNPVMKINPPEKPRQDAWINKTGSTNGFGAYVAFIPEKQLGIVILANKNFPIDARVKAAYRILQSLSGDSRKPVIPTVL